jgi:hypothetical protein
MSIPTWDTFYTSHQAQLTMMLETAYNDIIYLMYVRYDNAWYLIDFGFDRLKFYLTSLYGMAQYVLYDKRIETSNFYERLYYILEVIDRYYFTDLIDWSNYCHDYVMDWVQTRVAQINNLTVFWYENIQNINYYWYNQIFYYVNVFYDNLAYYSNNLSPHAKTLLGTYYNNLVSLAATYYAQILTTTVTHYLQLINLETDLYPYLSALRWDWWTNFLVLVKDIFDALQEIGTDLFPNLRVLAVNWFDVLLDLAQNLYGQIRAFFSNPNNFMAAALEAFLYAWLDWWLAWLVDGQTRTRPPL